MSLHVELRRGTYRDSVSLMQVSRAVGAEPGIERALVAMATDLNLSLLAGMGFDAPDGATPNDLVVALAATDDDALGQGLARLDAELAGPTAPAVGFGAVPPPRTIGAAVRRSGATLALISTPGQYAFVDAFDALESGASVLVFSDNVPIEQEVRLKDEAARRGLLVMGPDCGTAVVGGVGLGFANVVRPGPVGVVAASGTGAQQVLCLLDAAGVGVSHCLGVGGRDLSSEVGAASTLASLDALDTDAETELIVVVSKPPAPKVAAKVRAHAAGLATPVVFALLGQDQPDLTAAVTTALTRLGHPAPRWPTWPPTATTDHAPPSAPPSAPPTFGLLRVDGAAAPSKVRNSGAGAAGAGAAEADTAGTGAAADTGGAGAERLGGRRAGHLRGLFSGGTLCDEAMVIAAAALGPIASNIPLHPDWALGPDLRADGHAMIDFGDDELTRGRAHPMIDGTLRLERFAAEAADPGCGVILLDVVLGHGAHPDPAGELAPAIARSTADVVVSLCGSSGDPQGRDRQAEALARAGAAVFLSNAEAARYAVSRLEVPR